MLWLSVGVYQRRFGGFAELAAAMNVLVLTDELVKMLGLLASLAKPVNGK